MRAPLIFFGVLSLVVGVGAFSSFATNGARASIKGRVTDHSGRLLSGVEVSLSYEGKFITKDQTDEKGSYHFKSLEPGDYVVTANAKGFLSASDSVYVGPGEKVILDVGLEVGLFTPAECTLELSGIIKRPDGRNVADATITFVNAFNKRYSRQYRSNDDGRFELDESEYGQYYISVSKPGFEIALYPVIFVYRPPKTGPCRVQQKISLTINPSTVE